MDALEAGYKWVEENRQPATLRQGVKVKDHESSRNTPIWTPNWNDLFIERWKRRGWKKSFIDLFIDRNIVATLLREITYNWSWGLTGRHGCPISEAQKLSPFNDIPGATSSKLIFRIAYLSGLPPIRHLLSNIIGARNSVWRKYAEILLVSSAIRNVVTPSNYFPDNIKAGSSCSNGNGMGGKESAAEGRISRTDAAELDGQSEFQHRSNGRGE